MLDDLGPCAPGWPAQSGLKALFLILNEESLPRWRASDLSWLLARSRLLTHTTPRRRLTDTLVSLPSTSTPAPSPPPRPPLPFPPAPLCQQLTFGCTSWLPRRTSSPPRHPTSFNTLEALLAHHLAHRSTSSRSSLNLALSIITTTTTTPSISTKRSRRLAPLSQGLATTLNASVNATSPPTDLWSRQLPSRSSPAATH